jgi:serine phosphatase RsbU (regulator of sigma subunit)
VGGDFYDFFELPGNRLGLVIADVADKGMPAALFMTLIRTLVRANVQELTSPAAVLKRVNDILVPDAQQGMFVTIIYAVLDQKKGKLTYANAGHNPPLWLEAKNGEVHPLTKSAMALGVEEGTQVEERQITLHPGDFLIFYTDGLTEAFSGEGEMYGEEHLIWAVQNTQFGERADDFSARDMLQAIDASLRSFSGNVSLADDLTLMVLKRLSKHAKKGEERLAAGPEKPI